MSLNIEQIQRVAVSEKEEWQRKVNQGVLKADLNQSISALGGIEAVDRFVYALKLENGDYAQPKPEKRVKVRAIRAVSK